jgi:hypothetical protein
MGMPYGMADLLARKYAILQQGADSETMRAKATSEALGRTSVAESNLDNVRAGLLPQQADAEVKRMLAEEARIREETKYVDDLAKSSIGLNSANAYNARQQGGLYGAQTTQTGQLTKMLPRSGYGGFGWRKDEEDAIRGFYENSMRGFPSGPMKTLGFGN